MQAGAQKKQSPPAQHSALISEILHPAWLGAGCGPSRSSTCKWKTYHAFNTQLKEVLLVTLALTHNKGSMARTWKRHKSSSFLLTQSDEMLLPLLQEYLTHYHQTPDPDCRSRQTSLSLALVDQKRHISPSEVFTDSCQPEHLVATVSDTVSRRENTTVLTGILVSSFTLLSGLLGHSYLPIPLPGSADHPAVMGHTSVLSSCHSAQGHWQHGIRIPEDWTQVGVSVHEVWLCQSPPDGPGTRQALCVWPEEIAETSGHNASAAWGCPHGKQDWMFFYHPNKQNCSWRQQRSHKYVCQD